MMVAVLRLRVTDVMGDVGGVFGVNRLLDLRRLRRGVVSGLALARGNTAGDECQRQNQNQQLAKPTTHYQSLAFIAASSQQQKPPANKRMRAG